MPIRRKHVYLSVLSIITWMLICAQVSAQGTTGFEILRLQTHPRGSALAGAVIADAGNIESLYYNPAGLGTVDKRAASAGYMNYVLDIGSGYMSYIQPDPHWGGVWGVGLTYTNYGDFDGRSATGENLPTFSATDIVLNVAYAIHYREKFNIGLGGKFAYSEIESYTGSALAFDLGAQYTLIADRMGLGAGIFNIGWTTKAFVDTKDSLPLYYRIGIWGTPEGLPAKLFFSMTLYEEYADNYSIGNLSGSGFLDLLGEIYYSAGAEFHPQDAVFLRIGYDTRGLDQKVGTRKDALAGICGGFGLDVGFIRMDYGLASYGELGLVQRLSLSRSF
ncbi:hypothetical protein CEE37_10195 [candidate division LCP-89 bacterium B3_LCP]|uniref:PorV/PorQ family protein n=1 Tax=candidate division LCP-89 bacterium B3_LCP TaxID=2012998 RepID=A0A532UZD6_UNCL8|nr:MAG: hypothetical protein CEE37_10195 [candidate division LCP-89 bacterium B3_LCP]